MCFRNLRRHHRKLSRQRIIYIYTYTYIYITNCRQYSTISAFCASSVQCQCQDGGKTIQPPQVISHMWDHLNHARVLKLEKLVSMHNASSNDSSQQSAQFGHESKALYAKELYLTNNIYIYIYIYIYILPVGPFLKGLRMPIEHEVSPLSS